MTQPAHGARRAGEELMSEPQPELVQDLLRPQAYGADARKRVTLRTTHASWVFLIGDDVWKVKRPVDFGFLDFRTLVDRRHYCAEEVRLNRRLAPGIYLGVDPVRLSGGGHTIGGGNGPVVDWAVHMRRLPDQASAAALLARGLLGPERFARWQHIPVHEGGEPRRGSDDDREFPLRTCHKTGPTRRVAWSGL